MGDHHILDVVRHRGMRAFWAAQGRIPSWLHGSMWIVGGALRAEQPKDIDVMVDTELPIRHLGFSTTGLQGLRIPGSTDDPSADTEAHLADSEVSIDMWHFHERGSLDEYLRTVPLNIQSVAYSPRLDRVMEFGYLQCVETKTLDLMPEARLLIELPDFADKVKRIQAETGFRLSGRLAEMIGDVQPTSGSLRRSPFATSW